MLTAKRVREVFNYDPDTGVLTWRVNRGKMRAGDVAGCSDHKGHLCVGLDYHIHQVGRVAWLYMTGEMPPHEVDHKDGEGENNRWKNLRLATHKQNLENLPRAGYGASGFRGVRWRNDRGTWAAQIEHHAKLMRLGCFPSMLDAVAARLRAERELFTHHREN